MKKTATLIMRELMLPVLSCRQARLCDYAKASWNTLLEMPRLSFNGSIDHKQGYQTPTCRLLNIDSDVKYNYLPLSLSYTYDPQRELLNSLCRTPTPYNYEHELRLLLPVS